MKEIKKIYKLEIYSNTKINIIITDNVQESVNKHLKGTEIDLNHIEACFAYKHDSPLNNYIILPHIVSTSTIAHESFHATYHILSNIGSELAYESEETYAYLLGWITDKCVQTIIAYQKMPKTKKKK